MKDGYKMKIKKVPIIEVRPTFKTGLEKTKTLDKGMVVALLDSESMGTGNFLSMEHASLTINDDTENHYTPYSDYSIVATLMDVWAKKRGATHILDREDDAPISIHKSLVKYMKNKNKFADYMKKNIIIIKNKTNDFDIVLKVIFGSDSYYKNRKHNIISFAQFLKE